MYFKFGTRKIVEAAGVLLRHEVCRRMSYLRLLKLLYIADRESLRESGRPIVGTRVVAMKFGPVLSEVLDLVNGQHRDVALWASFIRKDGYAVTLDNDPGVRSLSRYEIERLTKTAEQYRDKDDWEIVEQTHSFQEWVDNGGEALLSGEMLVTDIPLADIIRAVGRSDEERDILRDAEQTVSLQRVLGAAA